MQATFNHTMKIKTITHGLYLLQYICIFKCMINYPSTFKKLDT